MYHVLEKKELEEALNVLVNTYPVLTVQKYNVYAKNLEKISEHLIKKK
jgi:hypothetical protein